MRTLDVLECPSCYLEQRVTMFKIVNSETHPILARRFLSGELHQFRCRACLKKDQLLYCTLYHDPMLDLMVWLRPIGIESEMPYEYLRSTPRCKKRVTVQNLQDLRQELQAAQEVVYRHGSQVALLA